MVDKLAEHYNHRPFYYDKDGQAITMDRWAELQSDLEYRQIGYIEGGGYRVSTVWLGMDHGSNPDKPVEIFETLVFRGDNWTDPLASSTRATSMDEANEQHEIAVDKFIGMAPLIRLIGETGSPINGEN
jgi:hypothetical protein